MLPRARLALGARADALLRALVVVAALLVAGAAAARGAPYQIALTARVREYGVVTDALFGSAVDARGAVLMGGSPGDASSRGAALVAFMNATSDEAESRMVSPTPATQAAFGSSISISDTGRVLAIGSPRDFSNTIPAGGVFVYERNDTAALDRQITMLNANHPEWILRSQLRPFGNIDPLDQFGFSVLVRGDTLLVGCPNHNARGTVFVYNVTDPAHATTGAPPVDVQNVTQLTSPTPLVAAKFGASLAIDGDTFVIGAFNHSRAGRAFVFRRSGSSFTWTQTLAPSTSANAVFGYAISAHSSFLAIGNHLDSVKGAGAGSVSLYKQRPSSLGTYDLVQQLYPLEASEADTFGYAVALVDPWLFVAAPNRYTKGAVMQFQRHPIDGVWYQHLEYLSHASSNNDLFGYHIAFNDNWLAIGAPKMSSRGALFYTTIRNCSLCPLGQFCAPYDGTNLCYKCPANTYSNTLVAINSSTCKLCDYNEYSAAGSSYCIGTPVQWNMPIAEFFVEMGTSANLTLAKPFRFNPAFDGNLTRSGRLRFNITYGYPVVGMPPWLAVYQVNSTTENSITFNGTAFPTVGDYTVLVNVTACAYEDATICGERIVLISVREATRYVNVNATNGFAVVDYTPPLDVFAGLHHTEFSVLLDDGSALPSWLFHNQDTLLLSGIPPASYALAQISDLIVRYTVSNTVVLGAAFTMRVLFRWNRIPLVVAAPPDIVATVTHRYDVVLNASTLFRDPDTGNGESLRLHVFQFVDESQQVTVRDLLFVTLRSRMSTYSLLEPYIAALPDFVQYYPDTRRLVTTPAPENITSMLLVVFANDSLAQSYSVFRFTVRSLDSAMIGSIASGIIAAIAIIVGAIAFAYTHRRRNKHDLYVPTMRIEGDGMTLDDAMRERAKAVYDRLRRAEVRRLTSMFEFASRDPVFLDAVAPREEGDDQVEGVDGEAPASSAAAAAARAASTPVSNAAITRSKRGIAPLKPIETVDAPVFAGDPMQVVVDAKKAEKERIKKAKAKLKAEAAKLKQEERERKQKLKVVKAGKAVKRKNTNAPPPKRRSATASSMSLRARATANSMRARSMSPLAGASATRPAAGPRSMTPQVSRPARVQFTPDAAVPPPPSASAASALSRAAPSSASLASTASRSSTVALLTTMSRAPGSLSALFAERSSSASLGSDAPPAPLVRKPSSFGTPLAPLTSSPSGASLVRPALTPLSMPSRGSPSSPASASSSGDEAAV